jgi:hypothetical protein
MAAVKEGIDYVIPLGICQMLNWKQLEIRATGNKSLDLEKLKSITRYEVSSFYLTNRIELLCHR